MNSIKKIERTYYFLTSLFWLATSFPISLFVLFIQSRGYTLWQIGLLTGVYSLVVVLLEVPTGGLADAVGRKKVAMLAYSASAATSIFLLLSTNFLMMLIGVVLMGIARALSSGTLEAWFIDSLQAIDADIDMQPRFAKAGTFTLLALGIGTLLGSIAPNYFQFLPAEGTAIITPLAVPVLLGLLFFILLVIATGLLVKEPGRENKPGQWIAGFRAAPEIIKIGFELSRKNPILVLLFGATVAAGFALSGIEVLWQPHFVTLFGKFEGNSYYFGIIMGGNFLVGMVGNMLATWFSKILNKRYAIVAGIFQAIWGIMLIFLAIQVSPFPATILFWLTYMSMGVTGSPHQTLLNAEIPSEQRSSMLSISSLFSYLGSVGGSIMLGLVADKLSIPIAWQFSGVILVVSLILYWRIDAISQKSFETANVIA
jgi:MFS transporter, DHA1 family, quinolone resistance protein